MSIITAITVELENMKADLEHAKKEAKLNRELAEEYKRKYEVLLKIRADKKTSPEGEEQPHLSCSEDFDEQFFDCLSGISGRAVQGCDVLDSRITG